MVIQQIKEVPEREYPPVADLPQQQINQRNEVISLDIVQQLLAYSGSLFGRRCKNPVLVIQIS